jgi:hypothetical protein
LYLTGHMHYIAPIPIIFGVIGAVFGLLWLVGAGSEDDGGPEQSLFFLFGMWYISLRIMKALFREPMSVLPGFGILVGGALLIWWA